MTAVNLVLGTAQFGSHYGIANKSGQPSQAEVTDIVREAWECGIREFDTAQIYGESEKILGTALARLGLADKAKIITKLSPLINHRDAIVLETALRESRERLGVRQLSGVMLHQEELLAVWQDGLGDILSDFVSSGLIQKIGISIYTPQKAMEALNMDGIDMVQVPSNLLDDRFEKAGVFALARRKNKQVYIRSIFLQGLILMDPRELPERLAFARPIVEKIESLAQTLKISRRDLAIGFIREALPDAKIVVGVDLPNQVKENCLSWQKRDQGEEIASLVRETFREVDERILNPVFWIEKK